MRSQDTDRPSCIRARILKTLLVPKVYTQTYTHINSFASLGLRFLLALAKKPRNYAELGLCGKVLAIGGCRGGLSGKRPGAAACQTQTVPAGSAMDPL